MSVSANTHGHLASPVLGTAINANLPERILAPLCADHPELDDLALAELAFRRVGDGGQSFVRDGAPVARTVDTVKALAGFVREFRARRLPRWRLLGIVD